MSIIAALVGLLLIAIILVDAFETIVLPRRVTRRLRLSRVFFLSTWRVWVLVARAIGSGVDREGVGRRARLLGIYAPLAVLLLLALWATGLVVGFALLIWGVGGEVGTAHGHPSFGTILYMSGTTFFTIGFGDVTPHDAPGRLLAVAEGATGFSFLAVIIGYLPIIFTAFAQRETSITLLDARAGSPPSAAVLMSRVGRDGDGAALAGYLREWERWSAELLESHLSYPMLALFRSQHENQSWLAALTLMLDVSALVIVGVGSPVDHRQHQARLTFAIARHAVGDLCQVLNSPPLVSSPNRLPPSELERLRERLALAGMPLRDGDEADRQLTALRALYEPYVAALAARVQLALPSWLPQPEATDDWETTAWEWDPAVARAAIAPPEPDPR
ncbi:MAG TPA: potassium channel family protein [Thermomicrobiales bacterium]|nr:potassium channel family protein [Thermomicrobiales bacterium]